MSRKTNPTSTTRKNRPDSDISLAAVILAAGEGKRMKSRRAKVLHRLAGRPMIEHVVRAALAAGAERLVIVVGVQGEQVAAHLRSAFPAVPLRFAEQTERLGTADAVRRAAPGLRGFQGTVLLLCGDVPALPASALRDLLKRHRRGQAALSVLTAEPDDPAGYGRIVREKGGAILRIVEERDAAPEVRALREINSGTYCAEWPVLAAALRRITPDNAQGEYYLTDAVRLLLARGRKVLAVRHPEAAEALGVNSRGQLALLARRFNQRLIEKWMDSGVTFLDPSSAWVDDDVQVGPDTEIHPGVTLEKGTRIGRGAVIRRGVRLTGCTVADEAEILDYTVAVDAVIGPRCKVGPFAHLRPGTRLAEECKIGNFVETKKASLGRASKANHLSYLGDAAIGQGVNIGAGTITCNYDGVKKHLTTLEDGVFIGSDTQLVAPVTVGRGAYVASGTTVTQDVPPESLAISRVEQKNVEGWVERRRLKMQAAAPEK